MSRARENLHFAVKRRHSPGDGNVDGNAKTTICKNSSRFAVPCSQSAVHVGRWWGRAEFGAPDSLAKMGLMRLMGPMGGLSCEGDHQLLTANRKLPTANL